MRSIEEIEKDITACQAELTDVRHEMETFEPDEKEAEDAFNDMLDECYGPFRIGRMEYCPSRVLWEVDPIAYYCGLDEFVDSEPKNRWPDYCDLEEREEELNDELTDLEDELYELVKQEAKAALEHATRNGDLI